jgi:hypothetical protein
MVTAFVPGSVVVFTMLPRWNGVAVLWKKAESQNDKYLMTVKQIHDIQLGAITK